MRNIIAGYKDMSLAEIGHYIKIRYAFARPEADGSVTQLSPFIKCRDFLADALVGIENKMDVGIYGWYWKHKDKIPTDRLYLLVELPHGGKEKLMQGLPLIHEAEKLGRLRRTEVEDTDNENVVFITASKMWMNSTVMVSLYTWLLRIVQYGYEGDGEALFKKIHENDVYKTDTLYLNEMAKVSDKFLELFMRNHRKIVGKMITGTKEPFKKVSDIHNAGGLASFCKLVSGTEQYVNSCPEIGKEWMKNWKQVVNT